MDFDGSLHFCVRQVRTVLGDSAAEPRYVENVPRRGYRLVPEVYVGEAPAEPSQSMARPRRGAAWVAAAAVLVGLALALAYAVLSQPAPSPVRIGIMPFQPPADVRSAQAWRPIAEWILEDMSALAGSEAAVIGPTTTAAYDSADAGLRRLAADYELDYVLNGRFLNGDGGPQLLAELIRVSDGSHVWVRAYDNPSGGQRMGRQISRSVVDALDLGSNR